MPNDCTAHLALVGPEEDLRRFAAGVVYHSDWVDGISVILSYDPLPEGAHAADYWGSKWPDYNTVWTVPVGPGCPTISLRLTFAWSPRILALCRIAAQFPALVFTLTYDESGFGFGGTAVWSGGVLRCDTYSMLYDRHILTVVDGATVTECFCSHATNSDRVGRCAAPDPVRPRRHHSGAGIVGLLLVGPVGGR